MNDYTRLPYVLGLDLGTSSCKVCALDLSGRFLGVASQAYPTLTPQPGWAEQDPAVWLPALVQATQRLLHDLQLKGQFARALAITSASHIGVLLDKDDKVLRPAILWNDQRAYEQAQQLAEQQGMAILTQSGNWPSTTWTLPHLMWIAEHEPQLWQRVNSILMSKDYITFLLTGQRVTDAAGAVSALLFDQEKERWSKALCDVIGLPLQALPDIVPIAEPVGTLTANMAQQLGLSEQAIVFNGTLDSIAETFSAGVKQAGECVIRLASAGGIHGITPQFVAHPKLISYPYLQAPYWLSQAGTNTCAMAVAWAEHLFAETVPADFQAWQQLAQQSPAGARGVMFHPYLLGERCPYWDVNLKGSFIGLSLSSSKADIARATYEGTAYSLKDALQVLIDHHFTLKQITLLGGGAKSRLWSQIVCNVLGYDVELAPQADSSTGGALICLVGLGRFSSFAQAEILQAKPENRANWLTVNAEEHQFYCREFNRYQAIERSLAPLYLPTH